MEKLKPLAVVFLFVSVILLTPGCQFRKAETPSQGIESSLEPKAETPDGSLPESRTTAKAQTADGTPKIVLTKASHDFGDVGPQSVHKAEYDFENKGNTTLLVNNVQTTCGCSQPTLFKDGKSYKVPLREPVPFEPGQSGKVEVTFTAGAVKSAVNKHLYIHTNDPTAPRAELELKANVVTKVSVSPESVDLRLDQENAGVPDLVVKSEDGKEFSITSITVANKVIEVPFDSKEKATLFALKPKVDIQRLEQFSTGVIQISTDHPQGGSLMLRYSSKPTFEVANPRYILQNIEPGVPILRENLIRSNYEEVAEIESAVSRNGYMEIDSQEQDGKHIKLMVKITPPGQDASQRRYISDELNIILKGGHKLVIRCSGWFRLK